jgi:pSer/pThr/pTyr-binding forkhead associated (FHA) protein
MVTTLTLRDVRRPWAGADYLIAAPATCVVGRAHDCDVRLSEGLFTWTVSRRHCCIDVTPQGAFVRDLGSRNGTFLNGAIIGRRSPRGDPPPGPGHALADGDTLRVGDLVFRVRIAVADAGAERHRQQTAGVS